MNTIDLSFSSSFFSVFMHFLLLFLAPFHCLDMDIIGYVFICCCSFEISMAAFRLFRLLFLWFWTPPVHKFIGFHHDMGIGLCHPPCCVLFLKFIYFFLCYYFPLLPFLIWTYDFFWVHCFITTFPPH